MLWAEDLHRRPGGHIPHIGHHVQLRGWNGWGACRSGLKKPSACPSGPSRSSPPHHNLLVCIALSSSHTAQAINATRRGLLSVLFTASLPELGTGLAHRETLTHWLKNGHDSRLHIFSNLNYIHSKFSTSTGFKTQAKNKICPSLTLEIDFLFLTNHIITSAAWGQSALSPRPSLDRCGLWSPPSMTVGPCLWSSRVGSRECPRSIRTVGLHWDEDSWSLIYLTGHNSNSCL